jgi:DNA-binding MarR family transcriptional regulator
MSEQVALPFDPIESARDTWSARGWEDAAAGMAAVTSVMRAHQIMLARVDVVLRPLGLTFARYEVLMLLEFSRTGALPLSKIGTRLQVHPASVTNAIDRLQEHGLVQRVPHPTDRRTTLAEITESGRMLARKATDALNDQVFTRPGLNARKVEQLIALLADLRQEVGDF